MTEPLATRTNRAGRTYTVRPIAYKGGVSFEGHPYVVVCEEHGSSITAATVEEGRRPMTRPKRWCTDCADG